MTQENFIYWLQGFMELSENNTLTEKQVQIIRDHLAQVFTKKTPDYSKLVIGNGQTDLTPSFSPYTYGVIPCTTNGTEPTEYYKSRIIC